MSSGIKKPGRKAPAMPTLSTANLPSASPAPAAAPLSPAFRQALGGNAQTGRGEAAGSYSAKDIARQAKAERPAAPTKGAPGKTHIGPRSGHK